MNHKIISLSDIQDAQKVVYQVAKETPVDLSRSCSEWVGTDIYLKFENLQKTGSFKIRGAFNKISKLSDAEKKKGVIACSAGNHAQGVALSCQVLGIKSKVVMPVFAPHSKILATQAYGAEVILKGNLFDESMQEARRLEKEHGYTFVHPYDDEHVIAGQGTIGLELLDQIPDLDSVVIGVGGGGLSSGVATAIKAINPKCRIYGVVAENSPGVYNWWNSYKNNEQKPKEIKFRPTIADGIAIKYPNEHMFESYLKRLLTDVVTVDEEAISQAMVFLLERAKTLVEGSAAISLAGAVAQKDNWDLGKKCALLLCGGNVDMNLISSVIEKGLGRTGRMARFQVVVMDTPGALSNLTRVIAENKANVLEVNHDRLHPGVGIRETAISFLLSTQSKDHRDQVLKAIESTGARFLNESFF